MDRGHFFWLVGDVYWLERVYSLGCAVFTILLMRKCWKLLSADTSALAVLFWLCIPIVGWCFGNNMLENTMIVFNMAAIYVLLRSINGSTYFFSNIVIASLLISCGVLVKGVVSLYPLVTLVVYALIYARHTILKSILASSLLLLLICAEFILLCYFDTRGFDFFKRYIDVQLYTSLLGNDSIAEHRFYLLQSLIEESLVIVGIIVLGKLLATWLKCPTEKINWKAVLFWLLLALSASLPMLISPKQLRFYIVPSMALYSLSFATLYLPIFRALYIYFKPFYKLKQTVVILLWLGISSCVVLSIFNIKKYARNPDMLPDLFILGSIIPSHTEIYLYPSLYRVWNLHAYMYRYFYIDLSTTTKGQQYALFKKDDVVSPLFGEYQEQQVGLVTYKLYKRQ